MLRNQITTFTRHYNLMWGTTKTLQKAHVFEHGCSYAVKHKEVREQPNVHSAFSSALLCSLASRHPYKSLS